MNGNVEKHNESPIVINDFLYDAFAYTCCVNALTDTKQKQLAIKEWITKKSNRTCSKTIPKIRCFCN